MVVLININGVIPLNVKPKKKNALVHVLMSYVEHIFQVHETGLGVFIIMMQLSYFWVLHYDIYATKPLTL